MGLNPGNNSNIQRSLLKNAEKRKMVNQDIQIASIPESSLRRFGNPRKCFGEDFKGRQRHMSLYNSPKTWNLYDRAYEFAKSNYMSLSKLIALSLHEFLTARGIKGLDDDYSS